MGENKCVEKMSKSNIIKFTFIRLLIILNSTTIIVAGLIMKCKSIFIASCVFCYIIQFLNRNSLFFVCFRKKTKLRKAADVLCGELSINFSEAELKLGHCSTISIQTARINLGKDPKLYA